MTTLVYSSIWARWIIGFMKEPIWRGVSWQTKTKIRNSRNDFCSSRKGSD